MKRFVLRTLLYLTPFLAALAYYYLFVDKDAMKGDLGRMSQTEFHYNMPKLDPNARLASCRDVATDSILPLADDEIVLFGDSFSAENDSRWPGCRWHQFLGGVISKRIVMTGNPLRPIDSYLATLMHHPERLSDTVIVETVERELVNRFCWLDFQEIKDEISETDTHNKETWRDKWNNNKRLPLQYYQRKMGIDVPVLTAQLDSPLFSCRPNRLFYYANDTIINSEWEIQTAVNNMQKLDSLSHANGITLILVAIPDKYTAYRNHLVDNNTNKRTLAIPCLFDSLPCFINTLPLIDTLIDNSVTDVYLPDDTHFSIPTAKAIGIFVANHIISRP